MMMNSFIIKNYSSIKYSYSIASKLNQSKSVISSKLISTTNLRHLSTTNNKVNGSSSSYLAINLTNKGLLRVSGEGSFIYLQSLLTNDMRKLLPFEECDTSRYDVNLYNKPVIYSYLLSSIGRVLCDLFVYRSGLNHYNGEYILEVDKRILSAVKRLLLGHNLSRNVSVEIVKDIDLWSLVPMSLFNRNLEQPKMDELYDVPCLSKIDCPLETIDSGDIILAPDPRIGADYFGYRFMTRLGGGSLSDIVTYIRQQQQQSQEEETEQRQIKIHEGVISDYIRLKYKAGVCEGYDDIQSGFYFPSELNGDFLNAICLDKGLYTSEESVVKVYSKGAIKRRIFPIQFLCSPSRVRQLNPAPHTVFEMTGIRNFGELRGRLGRIGIASLLVPMENNRLSLKNRISGDGLPRFRHQDSGLMARAFIPEWWPFDYDQIYLNIPDYPNCLFDFDEASKNSEDEVESIQFLDSPTSAPN